MFRPAIEMNPLQVRKRIEFELWLASGSKVSAVTRCPVCAGSDFKALASADRFGLPFGAQACLTCGLVLTSPVLKEEALPQYYERYYTPLTMGREGEDAPQFLVSEQQGRKIFDFVAPFLKAMPGSVLDIGEVGCGSGRNLYDIQQLALGLGKQVVTTGCEYSSYYVESARRELGINYIQGGMEDLVSAGCQFDLLILSHVFEHMVDLDQALRLISRLLKPEGRVYIEVPGLLTFHLKPYYEANLQRFLTHAHIYNFTLKSLLNALSPQFELLCGNEDVQALLKVASTPDERVIDNAAPELSRHLEMLASRKDLMVRQLGDLVRQAVGQERYAEASQLLEARSDLLQASPDLQNQLAELEFQTGRQSEAKARLMALTQRWPTHADAFNNLAVAFWNEGDVEAARSAVRRAAELEPFNELYQANFDDMWSPLYG